MPPPPPPPPPPVPANFANQVPKMTESRTHLLNEIHRGARLKKTVTNDRSAPVIAGKTEDNRPKINAVPKAATINESLGALFSTGVPRKPSDVKGQKSSGLISTPVSDSRPVMAKIKFVNEKDDVPSVKSSNNCPSLADLKSRNASQAVSSAPSLPPPLPAKVLKQNSAAEQLDLQVSRAPISQNAQFQTLRPAKAPLISANSGLRRSFEELNKRTTNMPSTIKRPGAPPPPPPPAKSSNPPPPPLVTNIQHQSQNTGYNNKPALVAEAPRPPPRISSCQESLEQRFHFVPISELPPPPRFIGFPKDYGIAGRKHQQMT
uniref:WH2 domain-containing protein n=2 Tax=Meloidogyne enterolobii TaxID=390850 RepID=A0A6V7VUZ5_MELEN|nr:unnamed protein product [Meloidogyne enterolobii]